MEFVNIFMKLLCCEDCDHLSEDHLCNLKYNMIVRTALIAHYCIKGGMTPEKSYSIRDYYIMKTDKCKTESKIRTVHCEMIESYTNKMRHIKLRGVYSKQIVRALDYIICHLHQRIFIKEISEYLKISPAYLSRLFKKETGLSFREYVNKLKIEEAASLLLYTQFSDVEISSLLAFSSQSYFIKIFKKFMGVTPKKYKVKNTVPALPD